MYVDLTMEVRDGAPVFPGYPRPTIRSWSTIERHGYYSNLLLIPEHVATHVDSPAHFVEGAPTIDAIPPERFFVRAVAIDFSDRAPMSEIGVRDFEERLPKGVEVGPGWAVLFRTGYDAYAGTDMWMRYPYIGEELAEHLAGLGVWSIGTDAPSPDHDPFNVHRILLPRGILIYESLTNLSRVVGRTFKLVAPPIKIGGGSGAPVRAIAELE